MNINRKHLALLAVVAMLLVAGCGANNESEQKANQLAEDTNADVSNASVGASYMYEVRMTEKNQYHLVQTQPPFTMDSSLERQNLIERYKYLNDENNVHHVYLIDEGQVMAYYVAQGKVSSVNSKLTNNKQVVRSQSCAEEYSGSENTECYFTVESPQMDGSYGTNGDAIFFFTADGDYVESNLNYVVSEEPRDINDEVILRENVNDDSGNSTDSDE